MQGVNGTGSSMPQWAQKWAHFWPDKGCHVLPTRRSDRSKPLPELAFCRRGEAEAEAVFPAWHAGGQRFESAWLHPQNPGPAWLLGWVGFLSQAPSCPVGAEVGAFFQAPYRHAPAMGKSDPGGWVDKEGQVVQSRFTDALQGQGVMPWPLAVALLFPWSTARRDANPSGLIRLRIAKCGFYVMSLLH